MLPETKTTNQKSVLILFIVIFIVVAALIMLMLQSERSRESVGQETAEEKVAEVRTLTHAAEFDYPGGTDTVEFFITIDEFGAVTEITGVNMLVAKNQRITDDFLVSARQQIVGRPLDDVEVLADVAGASLTTEAFNESLLALQSQIVE